MTFNLFLVFLKNKNYFLNFFIFFILFFSQDSATSTNNKRPAQKLFYCPYNDIKKTNYQFFYTIQILDTRSPLDRSLVAHVCDSATFIFLSSRSPM